jgi:D-glycero-alpha-D-manno-heptose 1-phosphate guanylyltransferase
MREAIILAGGMGTRLQKVVPDVPKPMAPVGGKPFLYHILEWLGKFNIGKVVISAGYKADVIKEYFGDSFNLMSLVYAVEEKPLGTGGAVIFAARLVSGSEYLIINGDTWFPIDLDRFWSFHTRSGNRFSIALKRMKDFSRYGSVECNGNTIVRFNEKKYCEEGLINGGIYLTDRGFVESGKPPEVFSLEKDLLEKEVSSGLIKCHVFEDPFIDIGIPEDYHKAQSVIKQGK